jgi:anti-sigma B factor antagonist
MLGGPDALTFNDEVRVLSQTCNHLIIDCSKIEIMNSSGLGMLISAQSTMKQVGGHCSLQQIPEHVQKLLELTRLNTLFDVSDS